MKKKAFVTCCLLILTLVGCWNLSLRERINVLEEKMDALESSSGTDVPLDESLGTDEHQDEPQIEEITDDSNDSTTPNDLSSSNPDDWLEVIRSGSTTEEQLLALSQKTAKLCYYNSYLDDLAKQQELAYAIAENPIANDSVMAELASSQFPDVWKVVAQSGKSGETALLAVAKNCATLNYYPTIYDNERAQVEIANILVQNSISTDAIMAELCNSNCPDVWKLVARSGRSGETALLAVAKKCCTLNYYGTVSENLWCQTEIAEILSQNPNSTKSIMSELSNSQCQAVKELCQQWFENNNN